MNYTGMAIIWDCIKSYYRIFNSDVIFRTELARLLSSTFRAKFIGAASNPLGKKALKGMGLLLTSPNGTRKTALLINLAGETVGEIFDGLPDNSIDASLSRQWYQLLRYIHQNSPVQSFILASNYMQLCFKYWLELELVM